MNQLVERGLIELPKYSSVRVPEPLPSFPNPNSTEKRESFKETTLAILQEVGEPINRMKLISLAIKRNHPPTNHPVESYHDAIRKLRREGKLIIDRSQGGEVEYHLVSLA